MSASVLSMFPLETLQTFKSLLSVPEIHWSSHGISFSIEEGIAIIETSDESKFHLSCGVDVMKDLIDGALGEDDSVSKDHLKKLTSLMSERPSWMASPSQSYDENVTRG